MGHFEPDPEYKPCRNPEHNPPTHLYVPSGMRYIHVCPSCGKEVIIKSAAVYYQHYPSTNPAPGRFGWEVT